MKKGITSYAKATTLKTKEMSILAGQGTFTRPFQGIGFSGLGASIDPTDPTGPNPSGAFTANVAGTFSDLVITIDDNSPGESATATIVKNTVNSSLSATTVDSTYQGANLSDSIHVNQGDLLAVHMTKTVGSLAGTMSFALKFVED